MGWDENGKEEVYHAMCNGDSTQNSIINKIK